MRFSLVALFAVAVPAALASAIPSYADAQNAVSTARDQVEQLTFGTLDNPDDACPDLIVRCVRKDKGGELVGEIGKKSFCHPEGTLKCKQCHTKINTAECNAKYPIDCAAKCSAVGSPI
ncbi:hypothetical protein BMF94_4615 [Rhodotorula taiwanensis]|uniref:Uncharacterized protein n=1 Tax=Rhodotorula taiwanensis TaxID=741276 RepID=A0A2S5B6A1_9BASI|nr:hypothetical protein BMF94_4615 [Rhodotorula taiwanensis]